MRDLTRLGTRLLVGGYLAAHGAQKLFGAFGGHGLDGTGAFFESAGLEPGRELAALAGGSELGGGALTALGLGFPVGPTAIAATMGVAASTAHRGKGPFAQTGGPELPLTNLAAAVLLAACGPGRYSLDHLLGIRVPRALVGLVVLGAIGTGAAVVARSVASDVAAPAAPGTRAEEPAEVEEPEARSA